MFSHGIVSDDFKSKKQEKRNKKQEVRYRRQEARGNMQDKGCSLWLPD
jgi:hypothetical protein